MGWLIWALVLPACVVVAGLIGRRLVALLEVVRFDHARRQFRLHREWLEARFLTTLGQLDPVERLRWEEARWQDDVYWGRDRQTRRLLAFVGVSFAADPDPEAPPSGDPPRLATALFEYRDGRWRAEGKHLDEIRPDEAFFHHRQFVPVGLSRRRS